MDTAIVRENREPRPCRQPQDGLPERAEEPPRPKLQLVHEARDRVKLPRDHGEPHDGCTLTQDRQPAEEGAERDEGEAARDVERAREVETAGRLPPPAALAEPEALPEAQPCPAVRKVVPARPYPLDHGLRPGLTIHWMLARVLPDEPAPVIETLRNFGRGVTGVSPYRYARPL